MPIFESIPGIEGLLIYIPNLISTHFSLFQYSIAYSNKFKPIPVH